MPTFDMDGAATRRGPLRMLGAKVLLRPGSAFFANALNLGLRRDLPRDVYQQLLGRPVELAVSDWGVRFRFVATPAGFRSIANAHAVDLRFIARARDYEALADRLHGLMLQLITAPDRASLEALLRDCLLYTSPSPRD